MSQETPTLRIQPRDESHHGLVLRPATIGLFTDLYPFREEMFATMTIADQQLLLSPRGAVWEMTRTEAHHLWTLHPGDKNASPIGFTLISPVFNEPDSGNFGIFITKSEGLHRGYATLAGLATANYIFSQPEITNIQSTTLAINTASKAMLGRIGFAPTDVLESFEFLYGLQGKKSLNTHWLLPNPASGPDTDAIERHFLQPSEVATSYVTYLGALAKASIVQLNEDAR